MKQEQLIIESIENAFRTNKAQSLLLGGLAASSGGAGAGGPPGGFIGYLPQSRVNYDLSELAASGTPVSGMSLVDNLNHIRYRITVLETASGGSGSGGHVIEDNVTTYTQRANLQFLGDVVVSDDAGNNRTVVSVTGSGGAGAGHTIQDEGSNMTPRTYLDFVGDGVTVTDDSGNNKTIVTISGGASLPWFNVKDYGAVGDGTTDDTTAIGNCISAANSAAASGVVIYFPAGLYRVTDGFEIDINATVVGDGAGTSEQFYNGGTFALDGPKSAASTIIVDGYVSYVLYMACEVGSIRDIQFRVVDDAVYAGTAIAAYGDFTTQRLIIERISTIGFSVSVEVDDGSSLLVKDCIFGGGDDTSLSLFNLGSIIIENNIFYAISDTNLPIAVDNFFVTHPMNILITGNIIKRNLDDANAWNGNGIWLRPVKDQDNSIVITNNIMTGIKFEAIYIITGDSSSKWSTIIANNVLSCLGDTGSTKSAIHMGYGFSVTNKIDMGAKILGNTFHSLDTNGGNPAIELVRVKNVVENDNTYDGWEYDSWPNIIYNAASAENIVAKSYNGRKATFSPSTTEDLDSGYATGFVWINGSTIYICRDSTPGAAVWTSV